LQVPPDIPAPMVTPPPVQGVPFSELNPLMVEIVKGFVDAVKPVLLLFHNRKDERPQRNTPVCSETVST